MVTLESMLNSEPWEYAANRKRVARLMRKDGLRGCLRSRRRKHTTRQDPLAIPAPDLVKRNFAAPAPNKIWTADITYLSTDEGFLYLAFILDVYSRKVVGWSMASHLRSELVAAALEMAIHRRNPSVGLVHHSDHRLNPPSTAALSFGEKLKEVGITPSMGRTGTALDNAMAESFVSTLKCELVRRIRFPTRQGGEDGYLRVSGSFLQYPSAALCTWLHESCRFRGR